MYAFVPPFLIVEDVFVCMLLLFFVDEEIFVCIYMFLFKGFLFGFKGEICLSSDTACSRYNIMKSLCLF
jgi:hypothetical protein